MSSTPGEVMVTKAPIPGGDVYAAHNATGDVTRLQFVTGHGLYTLPEDHMWHAGGIYDTGTEEWHYWTGSTAETPLRIRRERRRHRAYLRSLTTC